MGSELQTKYQRLAQEYAKVSPQSPRSRVQLHFICSVSIKRPPFLLTSTYTIDAYTHNALLTAQNVERLLSVRFSIRLGL